MAKIAILGHVLIAAVLCAALAACDGGDDGGCTDAYVDDCEAEYGTCMDNLDNTSTTYPEDSQACYDALCDCLDAAGCSGTGFNCGT